MLTRIEHIPLNFSSLRLDKYFFFFPVSFLLCYNKTKIIMRGVDHYIHDWTTCQRSQERKELLLYTDHVPARRLKRAESRQSHLAKSPAQTRLRRTHPAHLQSDYWRWDGARPLHRRQRTDDQGNPKIRSVVQRYVSPYTLRWLTRPASQSAGSCGVLYQGKLSFTNQIWKGWKSWTMAAHPHPISPPHSFCKCIRWLITNYLPEFSSGTSTISVSFAHLSPF